VWCLTQPVTTGQAKPIQWEDIQEDKEQNLQKDKRHSSGIIKYNETDTLRDNEKNGKQSVKDSIEEESDSKLQTDNDPNTSTKEQLQDQIGIQMEVLEMKAEGIGYQFNLMRLASNERHKARV